MRGLLGLAGIVGGLVSCVVSAQVPGTQSADPETDFSGIYVGARAVVEPEAFPFTTEGQRAFDSYDRLEDLRRYDDCAPESMSAILLSGLIATMEIVQEADRIIMRHERGDTARSIDLEGTPPSADEPNTRLGYSLGRWEGTELSIDTTRMTAALMLQNRGYPISDEARISERYWRNPGENDLQMALVVEDPVNYTQPLTFGREWVWTPDEQVRPWSCIPLGPRDSEPVDIDALRRRLQEQ